MLIPNINAIHDIVPPLVIGDQVNRKLPPEEQIYIRCRGIGMADKEKLDQDKAAIGLSFEPKERQVQSLKLDYELARKKFVSIHNYFVPTDDGQRPVTDFDDFVAVAPPELVAWFFDVIQWGEKLSQADRRNFLPLAVSPSGSQQGETATNGTAADAPPTTGSQETAIT